MTENKRRPRRRREELKSIFRGPSFSDKVVKSLFSALYQSSREMNIRTDGFGMLSHGKWAKAGAIPGQWQPESVPRPR